MRILVTGSRDWPSRDIVFAALTEYTSGKAGHTVVHGACPTGADSMAQAWADCHPDVGSEQHPADWSGGRKAGPERNRRMVELGASVCFAFISRCTSPRCGITHLHSSHGATGTADMAEAAGIPTWRYYA